jgi:hypothetical protein
MDSDFIVTVFIAGIFILLMASLFFVQPVVQADVVITNDTNLVDAISGGAVVSIDFAHQKIHEGEHFFTGDYSILGNGEVYDILYVTPNSTNFSHVIFEIETQSESMFEYYEGVTTSNDGTPLVIFNRNRNSDNSPSLVFYHNPIVVDNGTLLGRGIFGNGKQTGGGIRDSNEINKEAIRTDKEIKMASIEASKESMKDFKIREQKLSL